MALRSEIVRPALEGEGTHGMFRVAARRGRSGVLTGPILNVGFSLSYSGYSCSRVVFLRVRWEFVMTTARGGRTDSSILAVPGSGPGGKAPTVTTEALSVHNDSLHYVGEPTQLTIVPII